MSRKTEFYAGKRVKSGGKGPLIAVLSCLCVAGALAGAYFGLCAWSEDHILPNSSAGQVDLGSLSHDYAAARLEQAENWYQGKTVTLSFGELQVPCDLSSAGPAYDTEAIISQLSAGEEPFALRGLTWLGALLQNKQTQVETPLIFENEAYIDGLLDQVNDSMNESVVQHEIVVKDTYIQVKRGQAGMAADLQSVKSKLLEQLTNHNLNTLTVETQVTEPDEPDFEGLYQQLYVQESDASIDPATFAVTPSVTGVSFDLNAAQSMFDATAPGGDFDIPLVFTEPETTTLELEGLIFRDLLGEATSYVSGVSNRVSNVRLAGSLVTDTILMPGEEFSYWSKIDPCSSAQGFLPAPSYLDGQTVDSIGGGICQMSSSIYTAALHANMEIVERRPHSFAVGYLPDGSDAMVSGGTSDFRFKNNTAYPIKIVVNMDERNLNVQIWGTKLDDTYVQMEFNRLSTTPYATIYKIDDSVPAGTERESVSAYTGRKVEAYRCVYAGDGTLLSRTFESTNSYRKRDRVLLINSADAAKYGLDATGQPLPSPDPNAGATTPGTATTNPGTATTNPGTTTTDPGTATTTPGAATTDPGAANTNPGTTNTDPIIVTDPSLPPPAATPTPVVTLPPVDPAPTPAPTPTPDPAVSESPLPDFNFGTEVTP